MTELQKAYQMVYEDITNKGGLFVGQYDAKNGNSAFMHGIGTVMEFIAIEVSPKTYHEFSDLFIKNMIKSEKKVLTNGLL